MSAPLSLNAKVVIVGDAMLDRYLDGQASRISPEAPVPVLRVRSLHDVPGGAANVALNIAALGGTVTLVSYVGADADAQCLRALLETAGVRCRFVAAKDARTIVKLRARSMHQQMLRLDFEDDFAREDHAALHAIIAEELGDARALVLSDYGKGTLTDVAPMIASARAAGLPTIVDPKGSDFTRYAGADVITPNESEFRQASRSLAYAILMSMVRGKAIRVLWPRSPITCSTRLKKMAPPNCSARMVTLKRACNHATSFMSKTSLR